MVIILHLETVENLPVIKRILNPVILNSTDKLVEMIELWAVDSVTEMNELWVVNSGDKMVCEEIPAFEYKKYKSEAIETVISESWKMFEYKIQVPVFILIEFFWYTIVKQFGFKLHADKQKKNTFFVDDSIKYWRPIVLSTL